MIITDLCGKWEAFLDYDKTGNYPETFPDSILLPGSTSGARLGRVNTETEYGCLTDMYKFEGHAWFRRTVEITPEMADRNITLFLERTRKTAVYLDGRLLGEYCSLCAPHRYSLNGIAQGTHELAVRVDNTDYPTGGGHMTSRDTQTNWNGITGRIELQCYDAYPENVTVIPDVYGKRVTVRANVVGADVGRALLTVCNSDTEYGRAAAEFTREDPIECEIQLSSDVPLWRGLYPKVLTLRIEIGSDIREIQFGMRDIRADGMKLRVNGDEVFLRGKHDGMVFPETGYAPTDVSSWIKVFSTAQSYGINHYRFHTCCPPKAAFAAADIMGIYMQPELPFWGTIPDELTDEHRFLRLEGERILREYGHHPSFVMMSMGNELWGSKERLNEIMAGYKKICPDKLYVGGSNNYQFVPCVLEEDDFFSGVRLDRDRLIRGSYAMCDAPQGHIQTNYPNSIHNYDPLIDAEKILGEAAGGEIMIQYGTEMRKVSADNGGGLVPRVPVISHEVGQYAMYPDFDEIEQYKGSIKHKAYEAYKKGLEEKGLFPYCRDFFKASGALAADCYRRDIETALRSSLMSGFQLLDIQDFPGQGVATVGILNAFMRSKGIISPEDWQFFCGETVVLAELNSFVFTSGESIQCGLLISSTDPTFSADEVAWCVTVGGSPVSRGVSSVHSRNGRLTRLRSAEFSIEADKPLTAVLRLHVRGTDIVNSYTLYIYPDIDVKITESGISSGGREVKFTRDIEEAKRGGAIYIPEPDDNSLKGEYCTDFWCYGMFRSISESMGRPVPTGTLGLLIDDRDGMLKHFPTESHTTPPWYHIVTHSHCADLDGTDIQPDVWVIDNPERRRRLALLYRQDGAVCCTSRLWEIADRPEAKHFALSLMEYVLGE